LEFLRGVLNPIQIRITPASTQSEVLSTYEVLNPSQEPGKIVLVTSLGEDEGALRGFIRALRDAELPAVWMCDPLARVEVTRSVDRGALVGAAIAEIKSTALAHADEGSVLSGLCLEMLIDASEHDTARAPLGPHTPLGEGRFTFLQALHVCSDFAHACRAEG
jgi:3-deoxy-7-phosphoheptulonate synthase